MRCINEDVFPKKGPKAAIRKDICDGCAICVDVCPAACLRVGRNPDRPGARIIKLAAKDCTGCGACQGTCPKEAIYLPGLSAADIRRFVDQALAMGN